VFPDFSKLVKSASGVSLLSEGTFIVAALDSLLNLAQSFEVAGDPELFSSPRHISGPGSVADKAGVVSMLISSKLAQPETKKPYTLCKIYTWLPEHIPKQKIKGLNRFCMITLLFLHIIIYESQNSDILMTNRDLLNYQHPFFQLCYLQ